MTLEFEGTDYVHSSGGLVLHVLTVRIEFEYDAPQDNFEHTASALANELVHHQHLSIM